MFDSIKNYISANFFDDKLRTHYGNYILQSLIIFLCIAAVMLLYGLFGGIIVASLGASSFIIFVTPHKNASQPRYVVGGYICGSLTGSLFSLLNTQIFGTVPTDINYPLILLCAAAVAVTTFLMITINTEHPPAAALALGLTADAMSYRTALAALAGVVILCVIRRLLKKHIKDLI